MTVGAPQAVMQGREDHVLWLNVWYPVWVDDAPVSMNVTLLGVPVEVRAVPVLFEWDWADPFSTTGPRLVTANPGRLWRPGDPGPDEGWVGHAYNKLGDPNSAQGRAAGVQRNPVNGLKFRTGVTITVTTTWAGQFRIVGQGAWTDIDGQLTTTSTAGTFAVTEAKAFLVCDDLNGNHTC
jgi:hypothetical protein